jgi:hypothetical protein
METTSGIFPRTTSGVTPRTRFRGRRPSCRVAIIGAISVSGVPAYPRRDRSLTSSASITQRRLGELQCRHRSSSDLDADQQLTIPTAGPLRVRRSGRSPIAEPHRVAAQSLDFVSDPCHRPDRTAAWKSTGQSSLVHAISRSVRTTSCRRAARGGERVHLFRATRWWTRRRRSADRVGALRRVGELELNRFRRLFGWLTFAPSLTANGALFVTMS